MHTAPRAPLSTNPRRACLSHKWTTLPRTVSVWGQARPSLSFAPWWPGWVPGTGNAVVVGVGPQDLTGHT